MNLCCKVIKQQQDAKWTIYINEFDTYIAARRELKPTLFSNSEDDLAIRETYYNLIKKDHITTEDIAYKLAGIDRVLTDPKLTKGWLNTHRCLQLLSKIRKTLQIIQQVMDFEEKYLPLYKLNKQPMRLSF
jgi:hypothetical protein